MAIRNDGDSIAMVIDTKVNNLDKLIQANQRMAESGRIATISSKRIMQLGGAFRSAFLGLSAISVGGTAAMNRLLDSSVSVADKLTNLGSGLNLSTEKLQQFARAGEVASSALSFDSVVNQISGLQKKLAEVKLGRSDAFPFFQLGIDPFKTKDAFEGLEKIRGVIDKIHPSARANVLERLGISPEMLNLLKLTKQQVKSFSMFTLKSKEIESINKMGVAMRKLKTGIIDLKNKAIARLAPTLTQSFRQGFDWLLRNSDKIISAIQKITGALGWIVRAIANAFILIGDFAAGIAGMKNGLLVLAGIGALVAASFKPLTFAFMALLLILDDIQVWRTGGESLFGGLYDGIAKLIEKFKGISGIGDVFKLLREGIVRLHTAMPALAMAVEAMAAAFLMLEAIKFAKIVAGIRNIALAQALLTAAKSKVALAALAGVAVAGLADLAIRGKKSVAGNIWHSVNWEALKSTFLGSEATSKENFFEGEKSHISNNKETTIVNNNNITVSSPKEAVQTAQGFSNASADSFAYSELTPVI